MSQVRVRFAPSPTGGLHLGGVRTVLYNYLFARQNGGKFIVRIEDTDQQRLVEGAEAYIFECLKWCGLDPDESVLHGGVHAPYRQSERKDLYRQYALQLVEAGHAYYAFDTPEEIEQMREKRKASGSSSLQYDHGIRMSMNNSLRLLPEETKALLEKGMPHVIRLKIEPNEKVTFTDLIRGEIEFDSNSVDDKVLLKADGMPTYHLAVVVDDHLMKITHAFRGEEWLPSAPAHILLWKHLFGLDAMPEWAHLPLILKPDGHGKLSKRDGERLGFPVYAMNWSDPATQTISAGFREMGFLPEAFINMLALLGWNDGSGTELFTKEELIEKFSIGRIHKAGARFDFEKAKWFNQEWIRKSDTAHLCRLVQPLLNNAGIAAGNEELVQKAVAAVKDRCTLLTDFVTQSRFYFEAPRQPELDAIRPKWNAEKRDFFETLFHLFQNESNWYAPALETLFKGLAEEKNLKAGELMLPLRIMLVGGKFGPGVFEIAETIGKEQTTARIVHVLSLLKEPTS
jgi:glutamyl-tRNA synthetase